MPNPIKTDREPLIRIVHPSDFSKASRLAFAHALKIALQSKADLELVHAQRQELGGEKDRHWINFPGVRATLARWKILPADAEAGDVATIGLRVKKVLHAESDPLAAMVRYCKDHPPDLLVLATHQRDGLSRWLHKAIAEPLARRSRAMTLFVPEHGKSFVSATDGAVSLRRILIPVDHAPNSQAALEEAYFLAANFDRRGVVFKIFHVGTDKGMPTLYLPYRPGWRWEERLVSGDPVQCILQEEADWSPDLVVMTTQGHTDFFDALRGSTTERVLRGVHCPVLAVPERPA